MRVDFYHLLASPLERALPVLLERVLRAGHRAVVLTGSEDRSEAMANALWTYNPNSWLPHGTKRDGSPADQPVWITEAEENPNSADVLVLTDGMDADYVADFARCLDMFDGNSEQAVTAARSRWSAAKAKGHELHYWQQNPGGGWVEKGA